MSWLRWIFEGMRVEFAEALARGWNGLCERTTFAPESRETLRCR